MTATSTAPPLSLPRAGMQARYTAVVVGSGYGAGVAASRIARAGQTVCVLERGREIRPGAYPDTLSAAQAEMQVDTSRGKLGNPDGLYNVHVNPDMMAVVGCGLGGTSLINANVALEIDERLFDHCAWPAEFRRDKQLLAPHVARARAMLDPRPYPEDFPRLGALAALSASARGMKQPFYRPPICVNFVDQLNPFGVPQPKCTLCGDCTSGCNDGAKNTTLMNYLPDAVNHGAEIFTQVRVSHVERDGDEWVVHFASGGSPAEGPASVRAAIVMLGAGSLGSTEILLRSRQRGLPLSAQLGKRFSGNGDVLAFGYDNLWPNDETGGETVLPDSSPDWRNVNGIGAGANRLAPAHLPGPCITGVIDMRGAAKVENGLVIESGVIPGALAAAIPAAAFMADALRGNFLRYGPKLAAERLTDAQTMGNAILDDPGDMTSLAYSGPVARSQTYLVMSVDDAAGTLVLQGDRLAIDWPGAGSSSVISRDNLAIQDANEIIRGDFIPNPIWSEAQGYKLVTVHPVGGCGMADDAAGGVTNHRCQVFAGDSGTAVHPGLYVCDGAAMPGPVGVNPLLTISAVAERACALLAEEEGWRIDYTLAPSRPLPPGGAAPTPAAPSAATGSLLERWGEKIVAWAQRNERTVAGDIHDAFARAAKALEAGALAPAKLVLRDIIRRHPDLLSPSFQFTETMRGFVATTPVGSPAPARERVSSPYELAAAWGRAAGQTLSFTLCVHTPDLHRLTADPTHPAGISGTVTCAALAPAPMRVLSGEFHLLAADPDQVETWHMTYDMVLDRPGGPIHFHGLKVLHQKTGSHWWNDLTTLFITVHDKADGSGPLLAQGVLTLDLEDLLWQGASIRLDHPHGLLADLVDLHPAAWAPIQEVYLARFAGFFGGLLFRSYGGMLADLKNYPAQPGVRPPVRPLRAPQPVAHPVALPDGFFIRLTRYRGGAKGPVILAPGFTVRASSFAIDTVEQNLVECLTANGYDVWLFDYRASPDSGSPVEPFTIDDIATVDWPAAVSFVREATGAADVQVLAHCVGSMSLLMALLKGLQGVRSVISSALTLHPVTNWLDYFKVSIGAQRLLTQMKQFDHGFDIVPPAQESQFQHEIDVVAWNIPVPAGEQCKNPVCHRVFSIFGPSYTHAQLNEATHNAMMEMFGTIALAPFAQISRIVSQEHVVDSEGRDTYLLADQVGRLALPISFVTGERNEMFNPETVVRTHFWLSSQNGPDHYDCHKFAGYAHMDLFIGRNAHRDVFPYLLARLDRFNAATIP